MNKKIILISLGALITFCPLARGMKLNRIVSSQKSIQEETTDFEKSIMLNTVFMHTWIKFNNIYKEKLSSKDLSFYDHYQLYKIYDYTRIFIGKFSKILDSATYTAFYNRFWNSNQYEEYKNAYCDAWKETGEAYKIAKKYSENELLQAIESITSINQTLEEQIECINDYFNQK